MSEELTDTLFKLSEDSTSWFDELRYVTNNFMKGFDDSHNLDHCLRVLAFSWSLIDSFEKEEKDIWDKIKVNNNINCFKIISFAAMTHDVLDHKYIKEKQIFEKRKKELNIFYNKHFNTEKEVEMIWNIINNVSFR